MPSQYRRHRDEKIELGPEALEKRPGLALYVGLIASHSSKLDYHLATLFTMLTMGREPGALAAYHALHTQSLKNILITSVAKTVGASDEFMQQLTDLFVLARGVTSDRSKIIHGFWAVSERRPKSLLLCDPADINRRLAEVVIDIFVAGAASREPAGLSPVPELFEDYQEHDFKDIIRRLHKACVAAGKLIKGPAASFGILEYARVHLQHDQTPKGSPRGTARRQRRNGRNDGRESR